jgi:hypothetical protein
MAAVGVARVPAVFVVFAVAGIPPNAGAPTVTNILSATGVSTGSGVPAIVDIP